MLLQLILLLLRLVFLVILFWRCWDVSRGFFLHIFMFLILSWSHTNSFLWKCGLHSLLTHEPFFFKSSMRIDLIGILILALAIDFPCCWRTCFLSDYPTCWSNRWQGCRLDLLLLPLFMVVTVFNLDDVASILLFVLRNLIFWLDILSHSCRSISHNRTFHHSVDLF